MKLEIVTPQELILSTEDVSYVHAPGTEGDFGILDNHAPMVATLKNGPLTVTDSKNKETKYQIEQGFLQVSHNVVTILAEGVTS